MINNMQRFQRKYTSKVSDDAHPVLQKHFDMKFKKWKTLSEGNQMHRITSVPLMGAFVQSDCRTNIKQANIPNYGKCCAQANTNSPGYRL